MLPSFHVLSLVNTSDGYDAVCSYNRVIKASPLCSRWGGDWYFVGPTFMTRIKLLPRCHLTLSHNGVVSNTVYLDAFFFSFWSNKLMDRTDSSKRGIRR